MPPVTTVHHNGDDDDDIDVVGGIDPAPMSRTHKYRKFMKPLLERKRRARINSYLDELKDLMVEALQSEGETITKLEKADVLELTLRHLQKLRRQQLIQKAASSGSGRTLDVDRYRAGYHACATEVNRFMAAADPIFGSQLLAHLGSKSNESERLFASGPTKASSPMKAADDTGYNSGIEGRSPSFEGRSPSPSSSIEGSSSPTLTASDSKVVWRPF